MELPPAIPLPNLPPSELVLDDLPCRTCSYNLRTLHRDGVCPECGTPVAVSLRTELLRDADPKWLMYMEAGCRLAYAGIWGTWLWIIFSEMLRFGSRETFVMPAAAGAMAMGTWMLASPDPSGIGEDRYGRLRAWARGLGIVHFAAELILYLARLSHLDIYFLLQAVAILARAAWGAALLWYLDRLSRRTWQSKTGGGYRARAILFVVVSLLALAEWIAMTANVGLRRPIARIMFLPFWWLDILFLYGAVGIFDRLLKTELNAVKGRPTMWRTAGSFLYSAKELFRRNNGSEQ